MVPRWARVTLKWEGSVHKRAEVIALPRRRNNRKARKSQANANAAESSLEAPFSNGNRNAKEGCRNGSGSLTFVLAIEQLFQFFL
jgi:hypothetical protein